MVSFDKAGTKEQNSRRFLSNAAAAETAMKAAEMVAESFMLGGSTMDEVDAFLWFGRTEVKSDRTRNTIYTLIWRRLIESL